MLKDSVPPTVVEALAAGNKIEAIKRLRGITGLGLKEAKDWVDSYERGQVAPVRDFDKPKGSDPNVAFTLTPEAIEALKQGSPIEAIRIIRKATGVGLAEAKSIVDELMKDAPVGGRAAARARPHLAPGEVAGGASPAKWFALIVFAVVAVIVAIYWR